jgi:hypothetical protein
MAQTPRFALDSRLSAKLLIGLTLLGLAITGVREVVRIASEWKLRTSPGVEAPQDARQASVPVELSSPLKLLRGSVFELTRELKVVWPTARFEELPSGEVYLDGKARISENEVLIKGGRLYQRVPGKSSLWQDLETGTRTAQTLEGAYALWTPYFSRETGRQNVVLGEEFRSTAAWLVLRVGTQFKVQETFEGGGMVSIRFDSPLTENPHFNARIEKIVFFPSAESAKTGRPISVADLHEVFENWFEVLRD